MAGKYNLSYESEMGTKVNVSFSAETLNDVVDEFKYFLKGCGFHENGVNDIRYGDDDICMMKDRIKSAIELLESMDIKHNNYYDLLKYLNDAYDM